MRRRLVEPDRGLAGSHCAGSDLAVLDSHVSVCRATTQPTPSTTTPATPARPAVLRVGHSVTVRDTVNGINGTVRISLERIAFLHRKTPLGKGYIVCVLVATITNAGSITSTGPFGTFSIWQGVDGRKDYADDLSGASQFIPVDPTDSSSTTA